MKIFTQLIADKTEDIDTIFPVSEVYGWDETVDEHIHFIKARYGSQQDQYGKTFFICAIERYEAADVSCEFDLLLIAKYKAETEEECGGSDR